MTKNFLLYFDTHRKDSLIAEVSITDENGITTLFWYEQVFIFVPCCTYYYGPDAKQPKFVVGGKYNYLDVDKRILNIF